MGSPFRGPPRQLRAASLAEMIRAGALDLESDDTKSKGSSSAMTRFSSPPRQSFASVNVTTPVRPLVSSWSNHIINMDASPPFLNDAKQGDVPFIDDVLAYSPFADPAAHCKPATHGVVKITNIPYGTVKNEIVSAIGRTANIVAQPEGTSFEAIHIIMERSTGKTMDCFVELTTDHEAHKIFERFHQRCQSGKAPRIQDRHIHLEVSSQAALMQELFPRAKCVTWRGQIPDVFTPKEAYDSGFRGFLTSEEMTMTLKHAQTPARSPFAVKNLQRPYENMISTLLKFPWFSSDHITIEDRCLLYSIAAGLLQHLMRSIASGQNSLQLSRELLQQLLCSTLTVPFSQQQKNQLVASVYASHFGELVETTPYQPLGSFGSWWPFEVLDKRNTAEMEVLQYYVSLIRKATMSGSHLTLAQREAAGQVSKLLSPFGNLAIDYGVEDIGSLTLRDVASKEFDTLHSVLVTAIRSMTGSASARATATSKFHPDDHNALDKYSEPNSPRSGSLLSDSEPDPFTTVSSPRFLEGIDVLSSTSGSAQLSPKSFDGGVPARQGVFNRTPGFGRGLNAASTPFSPRPRVATTGSVGMSLEEYLAPKLQLPSKPPVDMASSSARYGFL